VTAVRYNTLGFSRSNLLLLRLLLTFRISDFSIGLETLLHPQVPQDFPSLGPHDRPRLVFLKYLQFWLCRTLEDVFSQNIVAGVLFGLFFLAR